MIFIWNFCCTLSLFGNIMKYFMLLSFKQSDKTRNMAPVVLDAHTEIHTVTSLWQCDRACSWPGMDTGSLLHLFCSGSDGPAKVLQCYRCSCYWKGYWLQSLVVVETQLFQHWELHSFYQLRLQVPESWVCTPVCVLGFEFVSCCWWFALLGGSSGCCWMVRGRGWVLESGWGSGKVI